MVVVNSLGGLMLSAALQPEEAELAGLTFAMKWIDDGKPKLRESGTGGRS